MFPHSGASQKRRVGLPDIEGVMKTNLTILHGFKNEVISEKDMNEYVEKANIAVEKWEWEEKFRKEKEGSD